MLGIWDKEKQHSKGIDEEGWLASVINVLLDMRDGKDRIWVFKLK